MNPKPIHEDAEVVRLNSSDCNDIHPSEQPPTRRSIKGIAYMALGSFSFSVMFLMVKWMQDTNTFVLVFWRSIIQSFIALVSLVGGWMIRTAAGKPQEQFSLMETLLGPSDWETRLFLGLRGSLGASAICAFYYGIQRLPLPDAVTLQFTTPPFAALFAVCVVGEQWKLLDRIGAVVCLLGVALIAHPTWLFGGSDGTTSSESERQTMAILVTIAGAAMAGLAYVSVRKIGHNAPAMVMVWYDGVLCLPIVVVGSLFMEDSINVWSFGRELSWKDGILVICMGVAAFGGQWFTNLGLQNETAATATLVTTTQIIWTYAFNLLFLSEPLSGTSVAGSAVILGYMSFVAAMKARSTTSSDSEGKGNSSFKHAVIPREDSMVGLEEAYANEANQALEVASKTHTLYDIPDVSMLVV